MELNELKQQVDDGAAVMRMTETEGWKILEAHWTEQLKAYEADNAINAKDWTDYLDKRAKIFAMRLFLIDVQEFIEHGQKASEEIDALKQTA